MKLKSIVLAVAASGLVAGQAHALAPSEVVNYSIYASGATAQDNAFGTLFSEICVAGTYDAYYDNSTATPGAAQRAYSCEIDGTKVTGLGITNPKVILYKRAAGGSGMGVQPVADGATIEFMNVNAGNCTLVSPNVYNCGYNASTNKQLHVTEAGVSDVEPALFVGVNVPSGYTDVTPAQLAKLDVKSVRAGVFGIPVTLALRNALQQAQGLVVNDETEANMPSLSKIQVASLMAKNGIKNWNDVKVNGVSLPAVAGVTAPSDTKVHICRRVNGSGTQAQFNANFLGYPCTSGSLQPADATGFSGPVVVLNSGSGDVENCLQTKHASNIWAVGVQSTEKNASNSKNYRFIKIDGVSPTLEHVYDNTYFDWVEESMQWRTAAAGGPTGDVLTILNKMRNEAGKPAIVNNANVNQTWGRTGYLTVPSTTYPTQFPFVATTPIGGSTHGTPVSNCRVPLSTKTEM